MTENLATALAAFQAELPRVGKGNTANAGTYSYQYADLADINAAILPLLGKHGLSFSSKPTLIDGRFVLAYSLRHSSGEADEGVYPLPDPTKASPQQIGSNISYARRYAFCAVTGVAPGGDDDDGAAGAPASNQPVERHERHYDPDEQAMLRDGYQAEIDAAMTGPEITEIGTRVRAKRSAGELSPTTYQHLADAAARRRAELDAPKEPPAETATVTPAADSPSRRQRQLDAMDRKVAQRKETADAAP